MGPYGITQVDVPGALNAMEAARSNRIRQMLLQRQLATQEREAGVRRDMQGALTDYFGGAEAGAASAPAVTPTAQGVAGAVDLYGGGAPATPVVPDAAVPDLAAATAPAAAPAAGDLNRLAARLMTIDPAQGVQIIQAFRQMDEAQFQAADRRRDVLARAAYSLLALPEAERVAEFNRIAPDLIANGGITRQQLAGFQLTERNLNYVIRNAREVEELAKEARPDFMNIEGEVIDRNALARGDPDPVRFRSEYIPTPEGLARRPGAGARVAPDEATLRRQAEEAIRNGADPAQVNQRLEQMLRGGPTRQGSGTFPGN